MTRIRLPDPDCCGGCGARGQVIDSRKESGYRRRRHACPACGHRWTTYQTTIDPHRLRQRPTPGPSGARPAR